jgi:hypothetical protein
MIIVSVLFASDPNARVMYDEAVTYNTRWIKEIQGIVNATIANPGFGIYDIALSSEKDKELLKDTKIEELTVDKAYKKVKARSAQLSGTDNNPGTPVYDKHRPRLVYAVRRITSMQKLAYLRSENDAASLFKVSLPKEAYELNKKTIKLKEYGFILIIEIGGHYKYKQIAKIKGASMLDQFDPDNLDHVNQLFDDYFSIDDFN